MSNLPEWLQEGIERELAAFKMSDLQRAAEELMQRYRDPKQREGVAATRGAYMSSPVQRTAYVGYRMPATYAVVSRVFAELVDKWPGTETLNSLLDLGAGPGTAFFAAASVLPELKGVLIEQDRELVALGKRLGASLQSEWHPGELQAAEFPSQQIVALSYVLNELSEEIQESFLQKAWNAAKQVLVLIEPGTPYGFKGILRARDFFLRIGAHIVAPCPHTNACPLAQIASWCHFAERVERSRIHRFLKAGDLGYEDEKYSYLIVARSPGLPYAGRLVSSPEKHSGHLKLCLCTAEGLQTPTYSKKQGELYKLTRKLNWGDSLNALTL